MFGLRKHEHCKVCGKPIPKEYEARFEGFVPDLAREIDADVKEGVRYYSAARRTVEYRGMCNACAMAALHSAIRARIAEKDVVAREERAEAVGRAYKWGYDRTPSYRAGYILDDKGAWLCHFDGAELDANFKCPKCGRRYTPPKKTGKR